MALFWIQTPSDIGLSEMRGWAEIDSNKYAAIRHHLLIVPNNGGKAKNGPIYRQMDWPIKTKYQLQDKIAKITKYTYGIQESITSTVTTKLSHEVLTTIGLSTGLDVTTLGAKLSTELQTKIGMELVESLQSGLTATRTYEVSTAAEKTKSIEIEVAAADGSTGVRPVFIYFKLRPLFWDVYLYRTDYLQLEFRPRWIWPDVRETIISKEVLIKQPLFRIAYYEPEEEFSFKYDQYEPEVTDADIVQSLALTSAFPNAKPKPTTTLEKLARLAFPVSKKEKRETEEWRKGLKPPAPGRPKSRGAMPAKRKAVAKGVASRDTVAYAAKDRAKAGVSKERRTSAKRSAVKGGARKG